MSCPHCSRPFAVSAAIVGKRIRCRGCARVFGIPKESPLDPASRVAGPSHPSAGGGDPIPFAAAAVIDGIDVRVCPCCGRAFAMKPAFAGKAVRCRSCRTLYRVAAAGGDPSRRQGSDGAPIPDRPDSAVAASSLASDDRRSELSVSSKGTVPPSEDAGDVVPDTDGGVDCPAAVRAPLPARMGPEPTALGTVVAIVLGGVTALPVTQLILWWAIGQDPFRIAKKLPTIIQWTAPESLRRR